MPTLRLSVLCVFSAFTIVVAGSVNGTSLLLEGNQWSSNYWLHVDCSELHQYNSSYTCKFVKKADKCQLDGGFINYFEITYCHVSPDLVPLMVTVLFIWLLFLFITLGSTAEDFFCPCLTVIAKTLKLNQNIAGVTFLAIGNGAPDIFSSYAAISTAKNNNVGLDITLSIGALFGAGLFVSAIVVGTICIKTPFTLTSRPFLRDVTFYLSAVFWTFTILWRQKVYLTEAIGIIALYVSYVVVVVIGRYTYQKHKKRKRSGNDIAFPVPRPGQSQKELVEGRRKQPQNEVNIHQAVALISGSDSGVSVRQENPNQANTDNDSDSQVLDVSRDAEDLESHQTIHSPDLDTISVHSDTTSSVSKASGRFSPHADDAAASHLPARQRSNSLSQLETSNDYDFALVRRLQQRRRQLGIKRMSFGIASALDIGESIGVAFLGHREIIHPQTSTSVQSDEVDLENDTKNDESTPLLSQSITFKETETNSALVKALKGLRPLNCKEWKDKAIVWKVLDILKIPVLFLLQLTVPVVDYEDDNNGWNKWLNVWHVFTSPVFVTFAVGGYDIHLHDVFPVWSFIWIVSAVVAAVVALTSKPDNPPSYHPVFAYLGFVVSIVWIYVVANEIVNVLETVGVVFDIQSGILGLTLLAWGNSIGDLVSDVTMANQGFPRMGMSACFGGPLLNLLLGFGIGTITKCLKSPGYTMHLSPISPVEFICSMFLMTSLVFSLVFVTIVLRFRVGRFYGICLILLYITFVAVAILGEIGIIHSPF